MLFCNANPTPVGRDALAQLRTTSDSAAVAETETKTETVATSQTASSKAERADALLARTRFADEPRPFDVRRQARPLERAQTPEETPAPPENAETLSGEELATTAAGFEPSELDLPFADFSRLVARRRGIADACESRGVALEIRNALRELAKRELATA